MDRHTIRFATCTILLVLSLQLNAQKYVVYSITGKVEVVSKGKSRQLKLREQLEHKTVLNLPYQASVELVDGRNNKKYIIKASGQGKVRDMLRDKNTSVINLTEAYLKYLQRQIRGKGETITVRCSDPATVKRQEEEMTDSLQETR